MKTIKVTCPSCKKAGEVEIDDEFPGDSLELPCPECREKGVEAPNVMAMPGLSMPRHESPLRHTSIKECLMSVFEDMKTILDDQGYLNATLFVSGTEQTHLLIVQPMINVDKDSAVKFMKDFIAKESADAWVLAIEGWAGKDITKQPSQDPNARDVVMIMGQKYGQKTCSLFVPFTKDEDGKITYEEPESADSLAGRFTDLLPVWSVGEIEKN
jgi:hypothetical protein